ncbi:MAG: 2'-5' RNA ligase family protein [Anaerolineales bacterium]
MFAIISELDQKSSRYVSNVWEELCQVCNLKAIYEVPTPHFSWLVAEEMDLGLISPILTQIAENSRTFTLHALGLGIFTGTHPILYLPLVKTGEMISLHQVIWDQIHPACNHLQYYYSPGQWVPHITLALKDLTKENMTCAVNAIAFEPIELSVNVQNLAIAQNEDDRVSKILERHPII